MAGIYIHIPFCKKICHYCDFYKSADTKYLNDFINSLLIEIIGRKDFLTEEVSTIYFGGGTPSVLSYQQISIIVDTILSNYRIADSLELTVELNPDDCSEEYLTQLKDIGVNRLSLGNQSFNNSILKYLNRRHNAASSKAAIEMSLKAGFSNISCDLIYGIPGQSLKDFSDDLDLLNNFGIKHLSAYHLTIESSTYFGKLQKLGKLSEIDEKVSNNFYDLLINWANLHSYDHYEVSNFCHEGFYSRHNVNYWFGVPYLGLGPSAHSFDGSNRFFNVSDSKKYIGYIKNATFGIETDILSERDRYNEFILLRLRTKWGVDFSELKMRFDSFLWKDFERIANKYIESGHIRNVKNCYILSEKGLFASDFVVREFFVV